MSFTKTINQFRNREKDVTRRVGWWFLKPGDILCGVEKTMGLKKGEKIKKIGMIQIISVRKERLDSITKSDVTREGFPNMSPSDFIEMMKAIYRIEGHDIVNRIEYQYIVEHQLDLFPELLN